MMQAVLPSHFRMRMLPGFSRMLWRKPGEVYYIGGADVLPNPLSPQQESAVIESLTKEDSQQARASPVSYTHLAKTIGGKGMLLWQGVAAYKLYTGLDMPVEEYKKFQAENAK